MLRRVEFGLVSLIARLFPGAPVRPGAPSGGNGSGLTWANQGAQTWSAWTLTWGS